MINLNTSFLCILEGLKISKSASLLIFTSQITHSEITKKKTPSNYKERENKGEKSEGLRYNSCLLSN